jgi:hypothetical protein
LGEILISAGVITREQLDDALARQQVSKKKLGEVLIEAGYADHRLISKGLRLQDMLIGAVLAAAIALAPASKARAEQTPAPEASAKMTVSAVVTARASLHILRQPLEVVVTEADVRRGFVDVDAASLIELKNNSPAGCLLTFETHGLPLKEAVVKGLGSEVAIGPGGGMITQRVKGTQSTMLSYRFVLAEEAQPGTYAWPLSVTVSPL